jgi:hypothetical protein
MYNNLVFDFLKTVIIYQNYVCDYSITTVIYQNQAFDFLNHSYQLWYPGWYPGFGSTPAPLRGTTVKTRYSVI